MIAPVEDFIIKNCGSTLRVLDFGCGDGQCGELAERLGCRVVFADVYKHESLNGKRFVFVDGNEELPFRDGSFDLIIAEEVVEHVHDHELLFEELCRILKSGGRMMLTTPNVHNWYSRLIFLFTGRLQLFDDFFNSKKVYGSSFNVRPVILQLLKHYPLKGCDVDVSYHDSTIPLLHWKIPWENYLTGKTMIIEIIKW